LFHGVCVKTILYEVEHWKASAGLTVVVNDPLVAVPKVGILFHVINPTWNVIILSNEQLFAAVPVVC
jgi:hypothetical protein